MDLLDLLEEKADSGEFHSILARLQAHIHSHADEEEEDQQADQKNTTVKEDKTDHPVSRTDSTEQLTLPSRHVSHNSSKTTTIDTSRRRQLFEEQRHEDMPSVFSFKEEVTETFLQYNPKSYVWRIHDTTPRFGHENRIGLLASSNRSLQEDYALGIKDFILFCIVPFILWGIFLLILKCLYTSRTVGCAAGGQVLDMKELARQGISRKERKRRILRSWRVQASFLISSILVPVASLSLMELGWKNVHVGLTEAQDILDDVESMAYTGWNVLEQLQTTKKGILSNRLVQLTLGEDKSDEPTSFAFDEWCPQATDPGSDLFILKESMDSIQSQTTKMVEAFDKYVPDDATNFQSVVSVTNSLDQSMRWLLEKDWIMKMILMLLNVVNFLLLVATYVLSKNNIIHPPSRAYLAYFLVPVFTGLTMLLLLFIASSGTAALLNADFCAGGQEPGSPQGSVEDALWSLQFGHLPDGSTEKLTGTMAVIYDSFRYYATGCFTESPLAFLDTYSSQVTDGIGYLMELAQLFPQDMDIATIEALQEACGTDKDLSFLPLTLQELLVQVQTLQGNMNALVEVAACHSISPMIRRISHGALCQESVYGLAWIWFFSFIICLLCFIMLSTRAALYNSVKTKRKREKQKKGKVEKEFEEYKEFMKTYYDDTDTWKMTHSKILIEFDDDKLLSKRPTFETQESSSLGNNDDDADQPSCEADSLLTIVKKKSATQLSCEADSILTTIKKRATKGDSSPQDSAKLSIYIPEREEEDDDDFSYDSSYESSSAGSNDGDLDDDDQSALLSFFVETKSILSIAKSQTSSLAHHTVRAFKQMKSMLGGPVDDDTHGDLPQDNADDDLLFAPIPGREIGGGFKEATQNDAFITPTHADGGDGLFKFDDAGMRRTYTPTAPRKPFSFISRTRDDTVAFNKDEIQPLTPHGSQDRADLLAKKSDRLQPVTLCLSPYLSPSSRRTSSEGKHISKQKHGVKPRVLVAEPAKEVPCTPQTTEPAPSPSVHDIYKYRNRHESTRTKGQPEVVSVRTKKSSRWNTNTPIGDTPASQSHPDAHSLRRVPQKKAPPKPPTKPKRNLGRTRVSREDEGRNYPGQQDNTFFNL